MDRRGREQRRDRRALGADTAVGQDDDVDPARDAVMRLAADPLDRAVHPLDAVGDRPRDVERVRLEDVVADLAELLELVVAQDRLAHRQLVRVLGRLVEQVLLGADTGRQRHHDGLADRVDRRVGDLREQLLEVGEERGLLVREHGERGVVAHRGDRLLRLDRHRRDDQPQVLLRVAERELAGLQRLGARHARGLVGQILEADRVAGVPFRVGLLACDLPLDLLVGDDPPLREVDEEDVAGLQAAGALDEPAGQVEDAGLGGEHDVPVGRLHPAARAQAVAVERRADDGAVGEDDGSRPVPRLHEVRVVVEEAADLGVEVGVGLVAVGLGDHHHHGVRQRAAREIEQLEDIVEGRRVRPAGPHDREDLLHVLTEQLGGERRLARAHPVRVALERVDLAVVGDHPVRVGELPARERVRAEPRVHECEAALVARVRQVREEARELGRREHPLVDQAPRGEAWDHEVIAAKPFGDAADHVEPTLEVHQLGDVLGGLHEQLADDRRGLLGLEADVAAIGRHVAPADDVLTLLAHRLGEQRLELGAARVVTRQEDDGDAVATGRRKLRAHDAAQERVGHLCEDPGAVAGVRIGSGGAAMLEVLERLQRALHDTVVRALGQLRDERDAARVVLESRVVEAVGRLGRSVEIHVRCSSCGFQALRRNGEGYQRKGRLLCARSAGCVRSWSAFSPPSMRRPSG